MVTMAAAETTRCIPMPIGTVNLYCWGWRKNGMPCRHVLFSGTVTEFKGVQRIKCPKCYRWTELTGVIRHD